jgi:uncharacterized membrane protein (DUF106 family)
VNFKNALKKVYRDIGQTVIDRVIIVVILGVITGVGYGLLSNATILNTTLMPELAVVPPLFVTIMSVVIIVIMVMMLKFAAKTGGK